jgi:hypothetical protein
MTHLKQRSTSFINYFAAALRPYGFRQLWVAHFCPASQLPSSPHSLSGKSPLTEKLNIIVVTNKKDVAAQRVREGKVQFIG